MLTKRTIPWSVPDIGREEIDAALKVLNSGWLTQGTITREFEEELQAYFKARNAVVVNSGTSGLICALLAHDIGIGDEVIVPTYTFAATVNSVLIVGAKPVLVDCDKHTFNVSPEHVRKKITRKTKAVMIVDVAGMPCDLYGFEELARKFGLILIEDAAEAVGAEFDGKRVGSFDHTTVLSFHMAKQLSTVEGGCVVTSDDEIAESCRMIRNHGMQTSYDHATFGINLRITDLQSAIGRIQLRKLDKIISHRNRIAERYLEELQGLFEFQRVPEYVTRHPWMIFQLVAKDTKERDILLEKLNRNGVSTRICWPPVHQQRYHSQKFKGEKYPNAEHLYARTISLPMGNALRLEDVDFVIDTIKADR